MKLSLDMFDLTIFVSIWPFYVSFKFNKKIFIRFFIRQRILKWKNRYIKIEVVLCVYCCLNVEKIF